MPTPACGRILCPPVGQNWDTIEEMLRFALPITLISSALAAAPALMPLPVTVRPVAGKLILDATFKAALVSAPDARLDAAIGRFVQRLSR